MYWSMKMVYMNERCFNENLMFHRSLRDFGENWWCSKKPRFIVLTNRFEKNVIIRRVEETYKKYRIKQIDFSICTQKRFACLLFGQARDRDAALIREEHFGGSVFFFCPIIPNQNVFRLNLSNISLVIPNLSKRTTK